MLYYLDTNIVIYAVEGQSALQQAPGPTSPRSKPLDTVSARAN